MTRTLCVAGAVEEKDVLQSIINQFMKSSNMSKNQIPMKRFATPKEIADVVVFLLGPGSSYITVSVDARFDTWC